MSGDHWTDLSEDLQLNILRRLPLGLQKLSLQLVSKAFRAQLWMPEAHSIHTWEQDELLVCRGNVSRLPELPGLKLQVWVDPDSGQAADLDYLPRTLEKLVIHIPSISSLKTCSPLPALTYLEVTTSGYDDPFPVERFPHLRHLAFHRPMRDGELDFNIKDEDNQRLLADVHRLAHLRRLHFCASAYDHMQYLPDPLPEGCVVTCLMGWDYGEFYSFMGGPLCSKLTELTILARIGGGPADTPQLFCETLKRCTGLRVLRIESQTTTSWSLANLHELPEQLKSVEVIVGELYELPKYDYAAVTHTQAYPTADGRYLHVLYIRR